MPEFKPTRQQLETMAILFDLIGFSGLHRAPEQGEDVILDLLPASHVALGLGTMGEPFCVRVTPDGHMTRISDEEAGVERPVSSFGGFGFGGGSGELANG